MARPSAASLNSLANVLREAQPLYGECGSILNYLETDTTTKRAVQADDAMANAYTAAPPTDTTPDAGKIGTRTTSHRSVTRSTAIWSVL